MAPQQKLTAILVDDEDLNIQILSELLNECASDSIEIIAKTNNAADALNLINELNPQLLFLDIKLDAGTSFDLLLKIEPYDYMTVFVTAYQDYVLDSFKFNAVNFIVKPITISNVFDSVHLALKQYKLRNFTSKSQINQLIDNINSGVESNSLEFIGIPEIGGTQFVKYTQILFCKSDGRYTEVHLDNGDIKVTAKNLGKYEELLPEKLFFRVHKSYIVNMSMIAQVISKDGNSVKLINGTEIPISGRRLNKLYAVLNLKG
jgi:two-component system LytT family response regulator